MPSRRISSLAYLNCYANNCLFLPVPLGSIPELPAETCQEIKMSEGGEAISGKYWFHSIVPKRTFLAPCDMKTEGESKCLSIFLQTKNGSPLTNALTEMLLVDCDSPFPPPPKKKCHQNASIISLTPIDLRSDQTELETFLSDTFS